MSLLNIDKDILLYCICKHLEPKDILNLSETCKTILELFPLNVRLRHVITILKRKAYPKQFDTTGFVIPDPYNIGVQRFYNDSINNLKFTATYTYWRNKIND